MKERDFDFLSWHELLVFENQLHGYSEKLNSLLNSGNPLVENDLRFKYWLEYQVKVNDLVLSKVTKEIKLRASRNEI